MKKFLALLLALVMVLCLAACVGEPADPTDPSNPSNPSDPTDPGNDDPTDPGNDDPTDPGNDDPTDPTWVWEDLATGENTYTMNSAMSVFPTVWNPHTYQTATDGDILGYISDGLYGFDYNEDRTGYVMVPYMATGEPVDVTDQYIGQYGLGEGAYSQAWIINLREDLYWENGEQITAHTFVESAMRLLNPAAQNYRADTMYSGTVKIHGAKDYLYQGQLVKFENAANDGYVVADLILNDEGVYTTSDGGTVYIAVGAPLTEWLGGNSLARYVNAYGDAYFNMEHWEELYAAADEDGYVVMTEETMGWLVSVISTEAWAEDETNVPYYLYYEADMPEYSWDNVGIVALSDYELLYVIDNPVSGFYLKYGMPSSYLVHAETYDACESIVDGVYTNSYGTNASNTISYGAYKMTEFVNDSVIRFERNEYYYDLTDDTYQCTNIYIRYVPNASTRLQMFLAGQLDSYGLQAEDMDTYQMSDYTYFATGDSTFAITFNPNLEALETSQANAGENINKTILTLVEFRMAMSMALDRASFCLAVAPVNAPAFGLYSSLIVSDPELGVAYRNTDVAKETLAEFWGVADDYGPGKLYEDIDEAIDSITGYNLAMAQQYFEEAYQKALDQGLMDEDDVIEICIGLPSEASFYTNGYNFLVNCYTEAVVGTSLEGKLTFTSDNTVGNNFADRLRDNSIDMLFGVGWTGSALDPYGLIEAYVEPSYQYDAAFDYTAIDLTIEIDGTEYTTSVYDWYQIMNGTPCNIYDAEGNATVYSCGVADNDPETRLVILGKLEGAILMNYNFIPALDDASASMKGMKYEYATEEYVFGMGFGGLKYYTFNYTDAEWAEFVEEHNRILDYT